MADRVDWTLTQLAEEAARRGRPVTTARLRQLCKRGDLRARKPGHDWIVGDGAAQRWLEKWLSNER
jgi:hypothetical protein